ncbi:SVSP family protein [Theileria parva strain Muguga]|uniref:Uncharacterized protein n=1 Tax=Theileria parva TaxID=5875 RepID=Q4MYF1_THEPA|nr:SVSP family protein [Theileria parva strain Muguga]EAN30731.1 SVSP family protein [Theileria parva strain Muguga]|eukprot:XP_763014.1 hypothetical protein [Theileria parva strain Muguga]
MKLCVIYTYIIIFLIFRFVNCFDKYPFKSSEVTDGDDDGDDNNFDTIIRGIESLLEEEDDENIDEHGFQSIVTQLEDLVADDTFQPTEQPTQINLPPQPTPEFQPIQLPEYSNVIPQTVQETSKHSYKHNRPTKPEHSQPSQPSESTESQTQPQTSDQPIEPSGTDQQLQPEHIQVELGSDEEEYDDEEPEEGAVGGAGGGDEDEEEKKKKKEKGKPSVPVKKCETITFYKKNSNGEKVEMSSTEYEKVWEDKDKAKYKFKSELEVVICDNETVYDRLPEKPHYTSLTHYKSDNKLVFLSGIGYLIAEYAFGRWKRRTDNVVEKLKLYTKGKNGEEILLTKKHYEFKTNDRPMFKYRLKPRAMCFRIEYGGHTVWEKKGEKQHPIGLNITSGKNIIIYFKTFYRIYGTSGGEYRQIHGQKIKKY